MTVTGNGVIDDGDSVRNALRVATGRGALVAGVLNETVPGFTDDSLFLASYDNNAAYNDAVAGRLLCSYNAGINQLSITSTNGGDVNNVRWVAIRI